MDRVEIGENTVIGSGSLVTKSFPSDVLAYGNPAKIIRNRTKGEKFLKWKQKIFLNYTNKDILSSEI